MIQTKVPDVYNNDGPKPFTVPESSELVQVYLNNYKTEGVVTIHKYNENNEYLSGAEFTITGKMHDEATGKDVEIEPVTFTTNGAAQQFTLHNGEYVLTETKAPSGYGKALPVKFNVKEGVLELVSDSGLSQDNVHPDEKQRLVANHDTSAESVGNIAVYNYPRKGTLTVTKDVTGNAGDRVGTFPFRLMLSHIDGAAGDTAVVPVLINGEVQNITFHKQSGLMSEDMIHETINDPKLMSLDDDSEKTSTVYVYLHVPQSDDPARDQWLADRNIAVKNETGEWFTIGKIDNVPIDAPANQTIKEDYSIPLNCLKSFTYYTPGGGTPVTNFDFFSSAITWDLHGAVDADSYISDGGKYWHLDGELDLSKINNPEDGQWVAEFPMKDGDTLLLENVGDYHYMVEETDSRGHTVTYTGDEGFVHSEDMVCEVINDRSLGVPTGVTPGLGYGILAWGSLGCIWFFRRRLRK